MQWHCCAQALFCERTSREESDRAMYDADRCRYNSVEKAGRLLV